ncbi:MAG: MurR/RpiR family transcriptional regulator [Clostridia bacterium]|jgi:DNA-binding MurR/RpiR family transcriptional regulator|nr:MurR/RpiR family transcriptional regulator [Clostridia bacterium]
MVGKVYDRINNLKKIGTKTEIKIIDALLRIPEEEIVYMPIAELASKLEVAESSLLRFCRKLDYNGFQDFKLNLSRELGAKKVTQQDDPHRHVAGDMIDAIAETCKQFDYQTCQKAAQRICEAKRLCAFGLGNSSSAPFMMKNRLLKAGIHVEITCDTHMQTIIASNMGAGDVIVLVSVSGATKDILNVAEIAKKNGVTLIVITNYDRSPIAKYADYIFYSCRKEAAYEGGPLSSVVAQAYIIDMLCTAVFEQGAASERILNASMAVSDKSI